MGLDRGEFWCRPLRSSWSGHQSLFFLLRAGEVSAFHRVASSELWQHLEGAPLELVLLEAPGARAVRLGPGEGLEPCAVVPPGVLQAARPLGPFALCGCTVAPGFSFEDFELPSRAELLARFPEEVGLVSAFTRG